MKIEFDSELMNQLKDAVMVEFLKDDLKNIRINLRNDFHVNDVKYDKKLIKAYLRILDYYGANNG